MTKKWLTALAFACTLALGSFQLFAQPTEEQCYWIVSDCELFCYYENSSSDPHACMLWCVPDECHPYI